MTAPLATEVLTTVVEMLVQGTPSISLSPVVSLAGAFTTTDVVFSAGTPTPQVVEDCTVGMDAIAQGTPTLVTTTVNKVYRRRDGTVSLLLKGIDSSTVEMDPELCETKEKQICVSLGPSLLEEDTSLCGFVPDDPGCIPLSLNPLGESSSWRRDSGGTSEILPRVADVVSKELGASTIKKKLSITMEVSRVVGMSCDG